MSNDLDFAFLSALKALEGNEVSIFLKNHPFPIRGKVVRAAPSVIVLLQDDRWVIINTKYLVLAATEEDVPRFCDWFGVIES